MQKSKYLSLENFETLKEVFNPRWEEVKRLFEKYGKHLSVQAGSALYLAAEKGKLNKVIQKMRRYFYTNLVKQHPEFRGLNDLQTILFFKELHHKDLNVSTTAA